MIGDLSFALLIACFERPSLSRYFFVYCHITIRPDTWFRWGFRGKLNDVQLVDIPVARYRDVLLFSRTFRRRFQPVDQYLAYLLMMLKKIVLFPLEEPAGHHVFENAQNQMA